MSMVFILAGVVLFVLGVVALFKPLPKIWLKTRLAAVLAIVLSVVSCGIGGSMLPAADLEGQTEPSNEAPQNAATATDQAEKKAEAPRAPRRNGITMDEYTRLSTGMTYEQAVEIIGEPGEEMSRSDLAGISTVAYTWQNRGGSNAMLMFQNDELVQKSQFGLR